MQFIAPLAFFAGLIAIPILLLYMLRLRRQEVLVSSNFLWQQLLEDNEANTPWQRLRRNLLLLLQLLILALMVLALARPFVTVPVISSGQTAILIDASASMNATDGGEGRTRFEAALDEAITIISEMGADDTITIIRVGAVPEVLIPYTGDRVRLRSIVRDMQPGLGTSDWVGALTLASGGVSDENFTIVIISDGGIGEAENLPPIPGDKRYISVGESNSNLAITALATATIPGQSPQLFLQVTNYSGQDASVSVNIRINGRLTDSPTIDVPATSRISLPSINLPENFETLEAELELPTITDYLALDDTAWTVSSDVRSRRVLLVTPGNIYIQEVTRSIPGLQAFRVSPEQGLPAQEYDLYIFDNWLPEILPEGDILIINPTHGTSLFTLTGTSRNASRINVTSADPRMQYVNFNAVNILEYQTVAGIGWADVLVQTDDGPLVFAGEVDGRQIAVLTFAVQNSDLPLNIAWPILMTNLVQWFTPSNIVNNPVGLRLGDPVRILPPSFEADTVRIHLPDSSQHDFNIESDTLIFTDTTQPGLYSVDVLAGGEIVQSQMFAVNLFDERESDITPVTGELQLGDATATVGEREELGQQEFWTWILLGALAVLLIEWYVYHQRLRVPTVMTPALRTRRVATLN